jgi:hypothetical protein
LDKERKEFDRDVVETRSISPLWTIICLFLLSSGGFFLGRYATSTAVFLQSPPHHGFGMNAFSLKAPIPTLSERQSVPPKIRASRLERASKVEAELARRKRFAAHAIHPALLTVFPVPTSIAIAIDHLAGNRSAGDLISEIVKYRAIDRITVIFVEGDDQSQCPQSLKDILVSTEREDIDMECSFIDPNNAKDDHPVRRYHDVSVVLANCGKDQLSSKWEEELYASTQSLAVKCVGRTYPLDHPTRISRTSSNKSNIDRIEHFFVPDLRANPSADSFLHATDYDVFDERGITTNFAVAFRSIKNGLEQWRLSEANYQVKMHQRWRSSVMKEIDTSYFDSADMLRIQFPSRHSAESSCDHNRHLIEDMDDDDMFCDKGLNPSLPNIPKKNFHVAKSTVGENAGRGVFTSIDLDEASYLMAEVAAHDLIFSFMAYAILVDMVDSFCLPKKDESNRQNIRLGLNQCIPGIYVDAYSFSIPGGVSVNSGISTFINHGCRGSANIGDISANIGDISDTEFTMLPDDEDPDPETFVIPQEYANTKFYNSNFERNGHISRYDTMDGFIAADSELLDDYVTFGGEKYFLSQIMALKEQCSGKAGTVLSYEDTSRIEHTYDLFGSRFVMDVDAAIERQLDFRRESSSNKIDELSADI